MTFAVFLQIGRMNDDKELRTTYNNVHQSSDINVITLALAKGLQSSDYDME